MKKLNLKDVENSEAFKRGVSDFREKKLTNSSVSYLWYKTKVSTKKWNDYNSKIGSYTFLGGDKNDTWIGFLAVGMPEGCLPITDTDELLKIDAHRRAINHRPFVTEDK